MLECLAVGIGGFIGAVSRYLMGLIIIKDTTFPFMTMMINIIGAFVIGLVVALASKYNLESRWILFSFGILLIPGERIPSVLCPLGST